MTSVSTSDSQFVYDQVQYLGYPIGATHPCRLIPLARTFGMNPAPADNCRVLELGCGDGSNLLPMASVLPNSRFVGVDLAQTAVAIAMRKRETLGLDNIDFRHMDVMQFDGSFGEFDFIIAHGVYSWVPAAVRNKIMSICQTHLSPQGVAYISYNVYPGCHIRQMMRGMMLYHADGETSGREKIRKAVELLKFLAAGKPDNALADELRQLEDSAPESLLHDDMGEENQPVYFHEFVEHAEQHELQFLAESDFSEMQASNFTPNIRKQLSMFAGGDLIRNEQYLDFLKSRRFRKTLLCRSDVKLNRLTEASHMREFYLSSVARPVSEKPEIGSDKEEEFRGLRGGAIRTNYPLLKAAIVRLGQEWPRCLTFEDLLNHSSFKDTGDAESAEAIDLMCKMLLHCYSAGIMEVHSMALPFTTEVSERPVASPYSRMQASNGERKIANLRHTMIELDGPGLTLLTLLDGTRDIGMIHRDLKNLGVMAQSGTELTAQSIQQNIAKLGKAALLMS